MKSLFNLFLISLLLFSCGDDNGEKNIDFKPINMSLSGVSQKGPFVIGSSVTIQELNESFSPNGTSFQVTTTDNLGSFSLETEVSTQFVEVICTGFYFNEISGQTTDTNLTVRSITPVSENLSSNINILTTLAKKRIIHLINEDGLSYEKAKDQAEKEVLSLFNISAETIENFDRMDISGNSQDDAALLAISILLQGKGSVSDLSTLTSTIIEDIESDGKLDSDATRDQIIQNAKDVITSEVRSNLINKYEEFGLEIEVPDFEFFIDNFYKNKPPDITITSPNNNNTFIEGESIEITVVYSDEENTVSQIDFYIDDEIFQTWKGTNTFTTLTTQWKSTGLGERYLIAEALDESGFSNRDSVIVYINENELPKIDFISISSEDEINFGSDNSITVRASDSDGWIKNVDWYLDNEYAGGTSNTDLLGENNSVNITGPMNVTSTNPRQVLRVDVIDNSEDTTSLSISVNLKPGAIWEEIGQLNNLDVSQAFADDEYFYIRSNEIIYRSENGSTLTEVIQFETSNFGYGDALLLEAIFKEKIWLIQNDDDDLLTTTIWTSSDQGNTWDSFTTDYILIFELFTFNNYLYAIDDNDFIHRLDDTTWTLVASNTLPWISDPNLDELNVIEYNNKVIALEDNLTTVDRRIWSSTDFSIWNETSIEVEDGTFSSRWITEFNEYLWIFSIGYGMYISSDGINWENITSDKSVNNYQAVVKKGESLYMFSSTGSTGSGALYQLATFGL